MPSKDPQKRYETDQKSRKKIYAATILVRIRHDQNMLEPLKLASERMGISTSQYLVSSAQEKLIRDGYMKPDEPKKEDK